MGYTHGTHVCITHPSNPGTKENRNDKIMVCINLQGICAVQYAFSFILAKHYRKVQPMISRPYHKGGLLRIFCLHHTCSPPQLSGGGNSLTHVCHRVLVEWCFGSIISKAFARNYKQERGAFSLVQLLRCRGVKLQSLRASILNL